MSVEGANNYPPPQGYPKYETHPPEDADKRKLSVYAAIDAFFILLTLALTGWYLGLMLVNGFDMPVSSLIYVVLCFLVLFYLALPRMHQVFTFIYVPDYFMARARTADGLLGDPVNVAFNGSEEDIHAAMQRAGWTIADDVTLRSSYKIAVSSVFNKSYEAAPVSPLVLFDKKQAFAYEKQVSGNASKRHHVRFWKTPDDWKLPGGHNVDWMAGATFDRGVGLSTYTGQVTHKIEEDTDAERDFAIGTLQYTDPSISVEVLEGFSSSYHSRNGGGDKIFTDGNLPIVDLAGSGDNLDGVEIPDDEEPKSKRDQVLPPPEMMIIGALIAVFGVVMALRSGFALANIGWATGSFHQNWLLFGHFAGAVAALVLLVLTFLKVRWARALLLLIISTLSVGDLVAAGVSDEHVASNLFMVTVSLILVMGMSSESSRRWVAGDHGDTVLRFNPRRPNQGVSIES